jgi:hypothetical protein
VNDKSIHEPGGLQRIQTLDGYIIPLCIKDGLARLSIRPYTDHEWDNHVILTSEFKWDPTVLDHDFKEDEQWGEVPELDSSFDEVGDYKHRVIVQHLAYFHRQDGDLIDNIIDQCVLDAQTSQVPHEPVFYDAHETELAIPEGIHLAHLHPPLLDQRLFQSVILITTSYAHSLVGLVQISSRRPLSTLHNMLICLLAHYSKSPLSHLIKH